MGIRSLTSARHHFACPDAFIGKTRQSVPIMGQHDSVLRRGPREDGRVGLSAQADILNSKDIELRRAAKEPAQDVAIEVLIADQLQHARAPWPWRGPTGRHAGFPELPGTPRFAAASRPRPRRA